MAESALYGGERSGTDVRIFKIGRVGFDTGTTDPDDNVFTGTFRTERISPAGPGGLVNFRRVSIRIMATATYTFSVKVWIDGVRTVLGTGAIQNISITGSPSGLNEITEEVIIAGTGEHIQVEITVDSNDVSGVFLIEGIWALGRAIREGSNRAGDIT